MSLFRFLFVFSTLDGKEEWNVPLSGCEELTHRPEGTPKWPHNRATKCRLRLLLFFKDYIDNIIIAETACTSLRDAAAPALGIKKRTKQACNAWIVRYTDLMTACGYRYKA